MSIKTRSNYPVAVRVAQILEERIAEGAYAKGAWLPTERTLASEFEVDRSQIRTALDLLEEKSLISRAPGCRPVVSGPRTPTVEKIPTPSAQPVITIAAILPQHPIYPAAAAILKGIQQALRHSSHRGRLLIFDTNALSLEATITLEKQALQALEEEDIAGGILWPTIGTESSSDLVQTLQERGRPIIYVDRYPDDHPCDFVGVDNRQSAMEAVEYLLQLGHRRIGYLTNTDKASPVAIRENGYREALRNADIPFDPTLVYTLPLGMETNGVAAAEYFFGLPEPPTAVFAMNDSLAHALIQGMETRGQHVPQDLSVIGFDDLERFSPRAALLTTMHQPFQRIGQHAAELLLQRFEEKAAGKLAAARKHLLLPAPMVVRETCLPLRERPAVSFAPSHRTATPRRLKRPREGKASVSEARNR